MKEFKWLACVMSTVCEWCYADIKQGEGFYYEATERKHYCRDCGRTVRALGFEPAKAIRENILVKMSKLFTGQK